MIDAQYLLPAQLGDAASAQTNLAMAQSLRSTSDSYKLMARIAESTMPKVRNAIELVQYAIFPVFLLFVVISGHQAGGSSSPTPRACSGFSSGHRSTR
jgi:conjugal transfer mating pair stabilization protein TraG